MTNIAEFSDSNFKQPVRPGNGHCEPTGRCECAPDDRLCEAIRGVVIVRLDRTIQYAAASRIIFNVSGILDRPVRPATTAGI
jgi:hypothetical protein